MSDKAAGEASSPSNTLTGPAAPERSVCAPRPLSSRCIADRLAWEDISDDPRSWLRTLFVRKARPITTRPRVRLHLESLEDRTVPAVFNVGAGDVTGLIAAINTSNSNGDPSNTINLTQSIYNLTAVNNYWYGPDGLPAISSNLTINGNGATIQRDSSAANFRLLYVSGGIDGLPAGNLTLNNLTLAGGVAQGGGSGSGGGGGLGAGGAIFNQGMLALASVTLTNDAAVGGSSGVAGLGNGGGGMGGNATGNNGGGFGGTLAGGPFGGIGGSAQQNGGGGGGGFRVGDNGQNGSGSTGGGRGRTRWFRR